MDKLKIIKDINKIMEGERLEKFRNNKVVQFIGSIGAATMGMGPEDIKRQKAKMAARREKKRNLKIAAASTKQTKHKNKI